MDLGRNYNCTIGAAVSVINYIICECLKLYSKNRFHSILLAKMFETTDHIPILTNRSRISEWEDCIYLTEFDGKHREILPQLVFDFMNTLQLHIT